MKARSVSRRGRALALFAAGACLLAGCGPSVRDLAGIKGVTTDVRYGGGTPTPSLALIVPPPASNPFSGFPPLITVPPPLPGVPQTVLTTPAACPSASPIQGAVSAATPTIAGPPASATYTYRDSGTLVTSTAAGKVISSTHVGPTSAVQVTKVSTDSTGAWHFTLTDSAQSVSASTDFVEQNGTQAPSLPEQPPSPAPQQATTGYIEVTGVSQTDPTGSSSATFEPGTGLELLQVPAQAGASWTSAPTDPSVADGGPQSWQFSGWVGDSSTPSAGSDRITVDACGTVLQGWQVTLTGTITAPNVHLTEDATYVFGTQYGGIPLMSHVHRHGTANGGQYDYNVTEVISEQPQPVAAS
ncbi:MAG: hypothetical protein ACYDAC_10100 [Candidatus Dormibacteria bacterium]